MDPTERFVLASASPRRKDLLAQLGLRFTVAAADIDETPMAGEIASDYVLRLAVEKARTVATRHPDAWVLAADTTVALGSELLGKPRDAAEARQMIARLSGRIHEVFTGIAVAGRARDAQVVRTQVTFRTLSTDEIAWYADTGEPLDKAGAYAIQGKGGFLVHGIEGSHSNVVGLPLGETLALLKRVGMPLPWTEGQR
ncbi:septum formation inhibitor Maf [Corallococcus sp. AB011P]|uniref:Maf family protein n=1 Tax=unclassified Corallococcus TaxID=2685029 RepID=UPI000EA18504|nr:MULTISPECIES: Maf family protein [unclassified Corallococcus]RKG53750.1 septum formation inhibitor Maf [Corallococcus sp. AB011P]RKH91601.1 septum formation inhibitor Maf [Corallococcus sp. AB045]